MQRFELDGEEFEAGSNSLLYRLREAHEVKRRPLCLCVTPPVPMYIARFDGKYLIKRMPGTDKKHHIDCESYEKPAGLSGFGDVDGTAIVEDPDSGEVTLKFGFALSKGGTREMPEPSGNEPDSIKADGKKLTLRGLLHYLWEEAGLTRWSPAMAGKRNWIVVRKYLLLAAAGKHAKKMNLEDMLYIPEMFVVDQKDLIEQRRAQHLARISISESGKPHFVLVIGELKEIAVSRFGFKLVIKHLPGFGLMIDEKLKKRIEKVFEAELAVWASMEESAHLMVIATASVASSGVATVQEVSFMLTTEAWIPFENVFDNSLIKALAKRRYQKCLRYNQTSKQAIATALLTDGVRGTALYIVPPDASPDYQAKLDEIIAESELDAWIWRPAVETMPALPLTAYDTARSGGERVRAAPARAQRELDVAPIPASTTDEPPLVEEPPPYTDADRPGNWL